jgi:hypothetical protein
MDELDEPTHPPITLPRPKIDPIQIDSPARVADGTQTNLGAAPRARATMPPPIPAAARKSRTATIPPPIPAAAMKPRGTTSSTTAAPPDLLSIDPIVEPPAPTAEPPATVTVAADIDVPIEHDDEPVSSLPLPPLPRPSQNWLSTTAQPPPPRTDQPRRRVAGASRIDLKPAPALDDDDDTDTPLPPPAPAADSGDEWPALEPRIETSAVADLFAPVAPELVEAKSEPSIVATPNPDVETSAKLEAKTDFDPDPERAADLFSLPPLDQSSSTTYFDRPATYNRRHLAAVGAAAVVLAILAAIVVRAAMKPPVKGMPVAAATTPTPTPIATPTPEPTPTPVAVAPESSTPTPTTTTTTIDVPITSSPSGATVTLISNGAPSVLGKTPLFASVDPAQSYDVVVTLSGKPTAMQHLDPRATKQIAVAFDGAKPAVTTVAAASLQTPAPVAAAPSVQAAPPAEHHHHHSDARVAVAVAEPWPGQTSAPAPAPPAKPHGSWNVAPAAKEVVASSASAGGGANGVLMVASKPPCEIVIDGKPTQLETPQRSIALSPGTHSVTLINAKLHINKTVPVQVAANKPTKLIQNFTGQ